MKHSLFLGLIFIFLSCGIDDNSGKSSVDPTPSSGGSFSGYTFEVFHGDSIATLKGKTVDYVEQGKVKNGKRQGFWIYHPDKTHHRPSASIYYINGILNGPYYTYTNNGDPEIVTSYLDGELHGDYIKYKHNAPAVIASYKNGKLNGKRTTYYTDLDLRNKVQKVEHYQNGVLEGTATWFNPEGNKTMEYTYKNGEQVSGGIIEN